MLAGPGGGMALSVGALWWLPPGRRRRHRHAVCLGRRTPTSRPTRGEREHGRTVRALPRAVARRRRADARFHVVVDPFMRRWRGRSVQALFDPLMRSMPLAAA